ncbi:MAG: glycosyltransferase family 4 protein [Muribaculaceae bacterium]|nr:glycosyltransferase family 4 protein [Muribaculaceae bacterium]
MRIAYDGKRAALNSTGLGNYSRLVIGSMAQAYPQNQHIVLSTRLPKNHLAGELSDFDNISLVAAPHRRTASLWRLGGGILRTAQAQGAEIYHGLSAELPIGITRSKLKSVVTVHDLIFRHFPHYFSAADRAIYNAKISHACRAAHHVVAISEFTKREIVEAYGIDPQKIDVVYQSCDERFGRPIDEAAMLQARQAYDLPERYVLAVGRLVYHKNVQLAIESLRLLPDDVKLVVVGRPTRFWKSTLAPLIEKLGLRQRLHHVDWIDSRLLPAVYRMAQAMVFASFCEGFGLPILEAQMCGTPVLAATGSCLEETGGDAAAYFDPHDAEQLAHLLQRVLTDGDWRSDMAQRGLRHSAQFTRQRMCEQLMGIYEQVLQ